MLNKARSLKSSPAYSTNWTLRSSRSPRPSHSSTRSASLTFSTLIKRLLTKNKCEVLITLMVDSINRWLTHPDEQILAHIVEAFGTEEALKIAFGTGDRADALKNLYLQQLRNIAR